MPELHPLLSAALASAGSTAVEFVPGLAGPPPVLPADGLLLAGLWCARRLAPTVPAAARAEYQEVLARAERILGGEEPPGRAQVTRRATGRPGHLAVARLVADAARQAQRNPAATQVAVRAAVQVAARLEAHGVGGGRRLQAFLTGLDDELFRLEAVEALWEHAEPTRPPRRVLWRGLDRGRPAAWLLRLEAARPRWAALLEVRGHWVFEQGSLDDTLACVPDHWLAEATREALARDRG